MFRRFFRIRRAFALALAVAAVAAPAAVADTPVGDDQLSVSSPNPGRIVAGDPVGDRVRPDAPPVVVSPPPLAEADQFDWLDAGIGAAGLAALLVLGGTAAAVRTRRGPVGAA